MTRKRSTVARLVILVRSARRYIHSRPPRAIPFFGGHPRPHRSEKRPPDAVTPPPPPPPLLLLLHPLPPLLLPTYLVASPCSSARPFGSDDSTCACDAPERYHALWEIARTHIVRVMSCYDESPLSGNCFWTSPAHPGKGKYGESRLANPYDLACSSDGGRLHNHVLIRVPLLSLSLSLSLYPSLPPSLPLSLSHTVAPLSPFPRTGKSQSGGACK